METSNEAAENKETSMKILFINDGSFYSGLVTELLCFNGYTVYDATYASNIQNDWKAKRVDLILCYVPFPTGESLAVMSQLGAHEVCVPLLVISTYSANTEVWQDILALTSFCLTIPFDAELLFRMITEATGIKKRTVSFRASGTARYQNLASAVN